ncbi:MAG: pyridoxal-phosphate-dependent aminotransferase family protein, partial [Acidimicrobiia bacterium]
VVGVNGVFGLRMAEVAERLGAEVIAVDHPWGQPVSADRLLSAHPSPAMIAVVHAETSTGVRSEIKEIGASKGDALLVMDCVTSVGGIPVEVDGWGVDIAYAGTQKCLGAPPGLAPFTASDRALERMLNRPPSWYLDLNLIAAYVTDEGSGRAYHHTAPINDIRALHAALGAILDEGLDAVQARHRECGELLAEGLSNLGFSPFAAEGSRLPHLATAYLPDGLDDVATRRALLEDYGIEVGGGLGEVAGKIWRVSSMGNSARTHNVNRFLASLEALM